MGGAFQRREGVVGSWGQHEDHHPNMDYHTWSRLGAYCAVVEIAVDLRSNNAFRLSGTEGRHTVDAVVGTPSADNMVHYSDHVVADASQDIALGT